MRIELPRTNVKYVAKKGQQENFTPYFSYLDDSNLILSFHESQSYSRVSVTNQAQIQRKVKVLISKNGCKTYNLSTGQKLFDL